jgi:hypothetical protein
MSFSYLGVLHYSNVIDYRITVVREVNSRVMENGVGLLSDNDRVAVESDIVCG